MVRRLIPIALVALSLAAFSPARSAANVTVVLSVDYGARAGAQSTGSAACPLSVPQGSDGIAVLNAAVANRCISSYSTTFGGGYITCVSGVCEGRLNAAVPVCAYWAIISTDVNAMNNGILAFSADNGDVLELSYGAPWLLPC